MNGDLAYQIQEEAILKEALASLIEWDHINDPMHIGIAQRVIDHGIDSLSVKQRQVYDWYIEPNLTIECKGVFEHNLELGDIPDALVNGGKCSCCRHMMNRDD